MAALLEISMHLSHQTLVQRKAILHDGFFISLKMSCLLLFLLSRWK